MKTKLEMAHEWYLKHLEVHESASVHGAWQYADAMQAEVDKREKAQPAITKQDKLRVEQAYANIIKPPIEEWQPDWSQAPDGYNYWAFDGFSKRAN